MHSWVFRHKEELQRIYGFPLDLLSDQSLEAEAEATVRQRSDDAANETANGPLRRVAMTPMPRRVS